MSQRGHRKCVKRPSAATDAGVTVTVTYRRPRLLGLPYVVEMFRKILAVFLSIFSSHHEQVATNVIRYFDHISAHIGNDRISLRQIQNLPSLSFLATTIYPEKNLLDLMHIFALQFISSSDVSL